MGYGSNAEVASGASTSVRDYITEEWTNQGYHCRSENVNQGIFEIVLPQIAPNFSTFMEDLLNCGVSCVDFRADSHECRLMVTVDSATELPEYVRRKLGNVMWHTRLAQICFALVIVFCTYAGAIHFHGGKYSEEL